MDKKQEEFIERFGMVLKRFDIRDRFNQVDSNIAKLTITKQAYQILFDMVEASKNQEQVKEEIIEINKENNDNKNEI